MVWYRSIFDAVLELKHDETFEQHDKIMHKYLKPDLLILDDMGMKQLPPRSGEYLFEIVMRRYERRSTFLTTNRPLEDGGKMLGDAASATAILDRLLHHAEIITITGKSYRLQEKTRDGDVRWKEKSEEKNTEEKNTEEMEADKAATSKPVSHATEDTTDAPTSKASASPSKQSQRKSKTGQSARRVDGKDGRAEKAV